MVIVTNQDFNENNAYEKYFNTFPSLKLSAFQKWAIKAIVDGDHSLITAHTGSGKTLPAEFAIQYFVEKNKKVIYTTPIKALSNTKLADLRKKYPHISFGVITGDITENPDADVLIMTTEILPATILAKKANAVHMSTGSEKKVPLAFEMDFEHELAAVIFDEVHYINDPERGSVWEQAIMLLPPHVQLLMLSATIDKAEIFAKWVETEKQNQAKKANIGLKNMYLSSTHHRVVPLTHHMWLSAGDRAIKELQKKDFPWTHLIQKPVVIKEPNNPFQEKNYRLIMKGADYFKDKKTNSISHQRALNNLIEYLKHNNGLPAICFVFSRKQVEQLANQIERPLFNEDESIIQATIGRDSENILRKKLPTYKEYVDLPEYKNMVRWMEKGVAIHHAGVLPVLREMVEILFAAGKIKLLIATETLAVGVNFSTKSVIFTNLYKFDGTTRRPLYSHEYTQMAGRAGRRGIDKVGKIWICANMLQHALRPSEMNQMITGPPPSLQSHFKISFPLAISSYANKNSEDCDLNHFVLGSMLQSSMESISNEYKKNANKLSVTIAKAQEMLDWCKTDKDIILNYIDLRENVETSKKKQKRRLLTQLESMCNEYPSLKDDIVKYDDIKKLQQNKEKQIHSADDAERYTKDLADRTISVLKRTNFIQNSEITKKASIALRLHEVHPLAMANVVEKYQYFKDLEANEIAAVLSCFTSLSISQDDRYQNPYTNHKKINEVSQYLNEQLYYFEKLETTHMLDTGSQYDIHYEMQTPVLEWCNVEKEIDARGILQSVYDAGVSTGEFVKAILKINNTALELSRACEELCEYDMQKKLEMIPKLTLKSIVTPESLYI